MENQRIQQGEMVDNQAANKANKHLKKRKKRKKISSSGTVEVQSWQFLCYSFSIQSCLSVSPRQYWSQHLAVLELSWFCSLTRCGEAFNGLAVQSFGVSFLLFGFVCVCVCVCVPSVAPAGTFSVWSTFGAGGRWAGRQVEDGWARGWCSGMPQGGLVVASILACRAGAWWVSRLAGSKGVGMAACWFSQCIMAWRRLPRARGSGWWSFSFSLCFTSPMYVSSVSARSLIHRVHVVCICISVTILDPLILVLHLLSFWLN
jgi:hypothetical protein